ncbi:FadR/GntR family transcriptional regulator [Macrococcus carouselicus]|uniref:FadR/GntR family transcriptional regulator n=1 Tax=Macrococcus carouselicus TaxID=69969 RepID=UPI001FB67104|nr:FadR/GntR family transcriptional regulator [Macrococcus carouselicus]
MARIEKKKLYEEIADVISDNIRKGQLKEGERLPSIQSLAAEYGVGQASIREAMNALRVMGLVDIRHGEGTFIKSNQPKAFTAEMAVFKRQDIVELLEVRKIIEVGAVRIAAVKRTPEQLKTIESALESMRLAIEENELGEKSDLDFHMAIAEAANNNLLKKLLSDVSDVMKTAMKETRKIWLYNKAKTIEKLYHEHLEIYEAIADKNPDAAISHMTAHLDEVEDVLVSHLSID